jgi:DNA-damage-inducible protein J
MVKSAMIRARVEPALKEAAERILTELGLNSTQAITLFYREVVRQRALPFELRLPPASQEEPGNRVGP